MLNLFEPLLDELAAAQPDFTPHRYGVVAACDGGLIEVAGLSVPVGALCRVAHGRNKDFRGEPLAEVIGFRNGRTLMMLLGDTVLLRPGSRVRPEGHPGMLPVGEAFLGRAVDGEGHPIDGLGPIHFRDEWPAGGIRTGALDRAPVRERFDTGVRALNALTTFGVGQRIGVMAGSGVGKSVLLDMIATGAEAEIVVVGLIGERAREVSDFVERHMAGDKRERTVVVAVPADHAPNLRIRGAMLATSIAEHFRAHGKRVLLIMDSLTRVAHAAREIALALGVPPLVLGLPGDNTYANYQEANRAFWRQTILPFVTRLQASLAGWARHAYGDFELRPHIDGLDALATERSAEWTRIGAATFLTEDEKREALGYGPRSASH